MYDRPRVKVKLSEGSTFTFKRNLPYIVLLYLRLLNLRERTRVKFSRVNKIEVMYDRPRVKVKLSEGSTFTFTRDLPYIVLLYLRLLNLRAAEGKTLLE